MENIDSSNYLTMAVIRLISYARHLGIEVSDELFNFFKTPKKTETFQIFGTTVSARYLDCPACGIYGGLPCKGEGEKSFYLNLIREHVRLTSHTLSQSSLPSTISTHGEGLLDPQVESVSAIVLTWFRQDEKSYLYALWKDSGVMTVGIAS